MPRVCMILVCAFCALSPILATTVNVPSADGPMQGDGRLDEAIWQKAVVLPLTASGTGSPFPEGGELRMVLRGSWLCLGARIPESGRVVARSVGMNPTWWREDLVTWTFRFRATDGRTQSLALSVNPLGGYRIDVGGSKEAPQKLAMAAVSRGDREWTVEAAVVAPELGFVWAERIRAPRPDAPELRWSWPGPNDRASFQLRPSHETEPPEFSAPATKGQPVASRAAASPAFAADFASIPRHVWSAGEQKAQGVGQMLRKHLEARVTAAAQAERIEWEKVSSAADWARFRDRRLAALKASFGPFPVRTPLKTEVTRRLDYGQGFVIENVLFESRPGLVVAANLYLPSKIRDKMPAVVMVHSHHAPKEQSELQDMGMTWARSGVAVLVPELLGGGERLQSQAWSRESYYSRYAMGMQLYLAGESLTKWMVWDLIRGIDMLLERPYVDPKRIVMIGAVAGGGDPAAAAAAIDERVAAVVPFNFGEAGPEEHYTEGPRPYDADTADPGWGSWETTRCLRRSIADQFFPWFICSSVAPRPFLYSFEIGWPQSVESEPMWKRYKKVFRLAGAPGNLDQVDGFGPFTGPGECNNVGVYLRKKIYPILNRWLAVPVPAEEYHDTRPDAELMCLTPKAAAERRPKTASEIVVTTAEERLSAARSRLSGTQRVPTLRRSLAAVLGDIEPPKQAPSRAVWSKSAAAFSIEGVTLDIEPGITVPLLFLKPVGRTGRMPALLALAQGGKAAFFDHRAADIEALLKRGVALCLADVRGTGEIAGSTNRGPGGMSAAVTELMLGGTMLGAQLKDARTVLRYIAGREDVDPARIAVWGDSFAGVNMPGQFLDRSLNQQSSAEIHQAEPLGSLLALLIAFYEDSVKAVAVRGGLVSYLSVLQDRFTYVPMDAIVPGVLEVGDLPDIVSALAPRSVLIEESVDGRNQLVSEEKVRKIFSTALVRAPGDLGGVAWLAAQLSR